MYKANHDEPLLLRNMHILRAWLRGQKASSLAEQCELGRERIRQIVFKWLRQVHSHALRTTGLPLEVSTDMDFWRMNSQLGLDILDSLEGRWGIDTIDGPYPLTKEFIRVYEADHLLEEHKKWINRIKWTTELLRGVPVEKVALVAGEDVNGVKQARNLVIKRYLKDTNTTQRLFIEDHLKEAAFPAWLARLSWDAVVEFQRLKAFHQTATNNTTC